MPNDPTPLGDAMTHRFPDQKIPEPKSRSGDASRRGPDISQRPALPEHPQPMAADIEDEEADPVIDTGPGIADGVKRTGKERGDA